MLTMRVNRVRAAPLKSLAVDAYLSVNYLLTGTGMKTAFTRRLDMKLINRILRNDEGATAIEYGLIAALIAVAAISAMQGLGDQLGSTFNTTSSTMANP